jgi:hypothetical protein
MKFSLCNCGVRYLVRANRSYWMRLFIGRRHFFCVRCRSNQLLSREKLQQIFPAAPDLHSDVTVLGTFEDARAR